MFQSLTSNLLDVEEQRTSAHKRLTQFPADDSIFEAATLVFTSVLRFLVQSYQFLQAKKLSRTVKSLAGGSEKLQRMFHGIQQRTGSLDRIASIVGESRECNNEIHSPLHG